MKSKKAYIAGLVLAYMVVGCNVKLTVEVSDQEVKEKSQVESETYYLSIEGSPPDLIKGEGRQMEFSLETNLPCEDVLLSASEWMAVSLEGSTLSLSIGQNDSGKQREGYISVGDCKCRIQEVIIDILQDYLPRNEDPPQRIEGMVWFEDRALKAAVLEKYDSDGDGELSLEEALRVRDLDVSGRGITSLVGLEEMHNLERLDFSRNDVLVADFSAYPNFIHLREADGSFNPNLERVDLGPYGDPRYAHCVTLTWKCDRTIYTDATFQEYHSEDFSWDELRILEEHTRGKGAYIVFEFDGYVDKDWQCGIPERLAGTLTDELFSLPPLDVFRDCFDVYLSEKVSPSLQRRSAPEASNEKLGVLIAEAEATGRYCLTINVTNNYGATQAEPFSVYGEPWGEVTKIFPRQMWLSGYVDGMQAIVHEAGHALGGLVDQYELYGGLRSAENFTYDSNPDAAPWSPFFDLERYRGRVGFYARNGGYYPSPESIMSKHHSCRFFDSPSRYALYYNCLLVAGLPLQDAWEEFLEYDRVNEVIPY